jgi:transcription elongation factor Elf1
MAKAIGNAKKKTKVEPQKYLCPYCGEMKSKADFYTSSDPMIKTGLTVMCKECAKNIARNYDERNDTYGDCTRASVQDALERLDKPFLEKIWQSSMTELNTKSGTGNCKDLWSIYIRNISSSQNYKMLRWRDGDVFASFRNEPTEYVEGLESADVTRNQQIREEYHKNREDVIRLIGYDPFLNEAEKDKPLLYSQLLGFLDTGGDSNEDMMRISSAISIVRGFLQIEKTDDMIADFMKDPIKAANNVGTIKSLQDMKKNVNSTITNLAAESCLSLKNNKNATKGENTWTGKIKKLKELNLREAEVNGFDIGTCRGMQQVLEISDASIMRQLNLDESEWSDMVAEQRQMLIKVQNERDVYKEINRILLRENLDLRDTLDDNGLLDTNNLNDLKNVFSAFAELESQAEEDDEE